MKYKWEVILIMGVLLSLECSLTGQGDKSDLESSYFPLAKDYKWVYERHQFGRMTGEGYDTFSIQVSSVDRLTGGWISYQLTGGSFEDVGNEVLIQDNRVIVFEGFDTIPLIPPESTSYEAGVTYYGDTLHLYRSTGEFEQETYQYVNRITGVGVISQGYSEYEGPYTDAGYSDRLLSFKKGDTIWRF